MKKKNKKRDYTLNLNMPAIRKAVQGVIYDVTGEDIPLSDISIKDNTMLRIRGKDYLRMDRHFHYPNKIDHVYAAYEYLLVLKDVLPTNPLPKK